MRGAEHCVVTPCVTLSALDVARREDEVCHIHIYTCQRTNKRTCYIVTIQPHVQDDHLFTLANSSICHQLHIIFAIFKDLYMCLGWMLVLMAIPFKTKKRVLHVGYKPSCHKLDIFFWNNSNIINLATVIDVSYRL